MTTAETRSPTRRRTLRMRVVLGLGVLAQLMFACGRVTRVDQVYSASFEHPKVGTVRMDGVGAWHDIRADSTAFLGPFRIQVSVEANSMPELAGIRVMSDDSTFSFVYSELEYLAEDGGRFVFITTEAAELPERDLDGTLLITEGDGVAEVPFTMSYRVSVTHPYGAMRALSH